MLGIDVEYLADGDPEHGGSGLDPEQFGLHDYRSRHPAFEGELTFDFELKLFGSVVTRAARVVWSFTPDWEYFDLHRGELMVGWEMRTMSFEVQSEPSRAYVEQSRSGKTF